MSLGRPITGVDAFLLIFGIEVSVNGTGVNNSPTLALGKGCFRRCVEKTARRYLFYRPEEGI